MKIKLHIRYICVGGLGPDHTLGKKEGGGGNHLAEHLKDGRAGLEHLTFPRPLLILLQIDSWRMARTATGPGPFRTVL